MSNSTTTNGGTVLTIPANAKWFGSISLSATLAVAVAGGAATGYPSITVSGAGGIWADGDVVLKLALFVPAVGITALTGALTTESLSISNVSIQTRENPISLGWAICAWRALPANRISRNAERDLAQTFNERGIHSSGRWT